MAIERTAAAGAIGGAAAETGSEYRARVGALLATTLIRRTPLEDVGLTVGSAAVPRLLQAETDDPVDDLLVTLDDDTRCSCRPSMPSGCEGIPMLRSEPRFASSRNL
ncbi:MAG TPA: hypothetical protein VMF35_18400 [Acidimicrobiales bacterium]|nr:hypothetical protein [Acidimicrobiales bacterium]